MVQHGTQVVQQYLKAASPVPVRETTNGHVQTLETGLFSLKIKQVNSFIFELRRDMMQLAQAGHSVFHKIKSSKLETLTIA